MCILFLSLILCVLIFFQNVGSQLCFGDEEDRKQYYKPCRKTWKGWQVCVGYEDLEKKKKVVPPAYRWFSRLWEGARMLGEEIGIWWKRPTGYSRGWGGSMREMINTAGHWLCHPFPVSYGIGRTGCGREVPNSGTAQRMCFTCLAAICHLFSLPRMVGF